MNHWDHVLVAGGPDELHDIFGVHTVAGIEANWGGRVWVPGPNTISTFAEASGNPAGAVCAARTMTALIGTPDTF
jgi:hypothetical protein